MLTNETERWGLGDFFCTYTLFFFPLSQRPLQPCVYR